VKAQKGRFQGADFGKGGCDPASGEYAPNELIIPLEMACSVAKEFFRTKQMSEAVSWFEL
jgi:hypothetical protein